MLSTSGRADIVAVTPGDVAGPKGERSLHHPSAPVLKREPPTGPEWLHEVKHDGWRAQLHKAGDVVTIYTRNGNDVTHRFKAVAEAVAKLPARSAIIDAEIIACDAEGLPNFYALMRHAPHGCCAYCFDLLEFDGRQLTTVPLDERRYLLRQLLKRRDQDAVRLSEVFDDPHELLAACEKRGLEGIVSKLRDQPYKSGDNKGWIKVKTAAWRAANKDRWELFQKG
jgi:bifunctional non-homologous end joining protein LigD